MNLQLSQSGSRCGRAATATLVLLAANVTACLDSAPSRMTGIAGATAATAKAIGGSNSRIVFAASRDGVEQIYTVNPDGTGTTRLTISAGGDVSPVVSPDGKRIAFTSLRDGNPDLYVMDADGRNFNRLTFARGQSFSPNWSKDGKRIAFISTRDARDENVLAFKHAEIYVMNADGTNTTRLTADTTADLDPVFSPDGRTLAFTSQRDNPASLNARDLYLMSLDGGAVTRLTFFGSGIVSFPTWDPHGHQIAFAATELDGRASGIYVINVDGTGLKFLTGASGGLDSQPSWSPDGSQIAFTSNRDGVIAIYRMNADGTGVVRVTDGTGLAGDQLANWGK